MPGRVLAALVCPHCGGGLGGDARGGLVCPAGHAFDVAREGYAGLLTGRRPPTGGDTAAMVADRRAFQDAGHYAPLARRLAALATAHGLGDGLAADVGAGTGYYLAAVLDAAPGAAGIALDVSKYALRRAAKAHPRAGAAACDAWQGLPLRTGSVSVLLNVFAPRDGAGFRRVLRDDGALLVVVPTARHLDGLVGPLGLVAVDARKEERLERTLGDHFTTVHTEELDVPLLLPHADAATAAGMGPSARHIAAGDLAARVAALPDPVPATASFRLSVHRPRAA
jgi:23S rRNA (guanine745-N1)-methyltransferase